MGRYLKIKLFTYVMVLLHAACGGGGGGSSPVIDFPTPAPDPGPTSFFVIGAKDDSNGLRIAGQQYDAVRAQITVNGENVVAEDLLPGQILYVRGTQTADGSRTADTIESWSNVIASVEMVDPDQSYFVALGRRIVVDDATVRDRLPTESEWIDVHGYLAADGTVLATRIDHIEPRSTVQVYARVEELDAGAFTFQVGDLDVDYGAAVVTNIAGNSLRDGARVLVAGRLAEDRTLAADTVSGIDAPNFFEREESVEITGFVTAFESAVDFEVAGRGTVATADTTFTNGSVDDLTMGVQVEVRGTSDANGRLIATRIKHLGNGGPGSITYDYVDFAALEIHGGWDVRVVQASDFSIELTFGEDVTHVLDVRQVDDRVVIAFRDDVLLDIGPTRLEGEIRLPALAEVSLFGASDIVASGMLGPDLTIDLQGASSFEGVETTYREVEIRAEGASVVDLSANDPLESARVSLGGSSRATLNMELDGVLAGDATGNSSIRYYGDRVAVDVQLSSGGTVTRVGATL